MKRFSVISLDADQTLFDFNRIMLEALAAVCEDFFTRHNINVSASQLKSRRDQIASKIDDPSFAMLELRRRSFQEVLSDHSIHDPAEVGRAMEIFESIRFGKVYFYNDTIPVLRSLVKSHKLALITNGNSNPFEAGIADYFSYSILAENCGFRKPDKRIFDVLLTEAQIPADELIHVGDSLETDVAGALNAGVTAVYLNREGKKLKPHSITPDHEISDLHELLEIVYS
ncbi:MAG: HAD family hydrolase [Pseudomonadales bacterium]|nr:HAD family hydrolase [Pseudomonadales bacterium]